MPLTPSQTMARVKSRNTAPEMRVCRLLTQMGYRSRPHRADIPGKPDIAFIGRRKAIFVHGCFWHGHDCRRGARAQEQCGVLARRLGNRARDIAVREKLTVQTWDALIVWECALGGMVAIERRLTDWLGPTRSSADASI